VEKMTYYLNNKIIPPKDREIIFDKREQKWQLNWNIRYSLYFNKIMEGIDHSKWERKRQEECRKLNKALKKEDKDGDTE